MNVKELMTQDVLTVAPETPLKDVAGLLARHGISGVPVCDAEGRVLGVVSEGDVLYKEQGQVDGRARLLGRLLEERSGKVTKAMARTAGEAMTSPPITITPERPAAAAARTMVEHGVNRLPVVRDGVLVGIVTRADLVRAFTRSDEDILDEIRTDVLRRSLWVDPDTLEVEVEDGAVRLTGELEAKSDVDVLTKLVRRIPGVVEVDARVLYRVDDLQQPAGRFAGYR